MVAMWNIFHCRRVIKQPILMLPLKKEFAVIRRVYLLVKKIFL